MRVVHVVHSFDTGGLEKGIVTLVCEAGPDVEHAVLCLSRSGESARLLPRGTPVIEMNKQPGNSLRFLRSLARHLAVLDPDVVHTRNWGGVDGILAARLAGLRCVVHGEHGWDMRDPYGHSSRRIWVRRLVSRAVREYTCVSQQMLRWLRDTVRIRRPVTQIYNGVDTERCRPADDRPASRVALGLPPTGLLVGVVGRLDPIKNHAALLHAFEHLRRDAPQARLLVVGAGPERARLEVLAGEGVVFLGNRTDVPEILRTLDAFVLPSWNEGISNTILEAMASGVAVVATRVGGNPELVEDAVTGTLVPAGDERALEDALRLYHARPELARAHGAAARQRAVERFDRTAMARAYEQVWKRVAGNCARARNAPRAAEESRGS